MGIKVWEMRMTRILRLPVVTGDVKVARYDEIVLMVF